MGVIVRFQPWWVEALLQYMDIIYRSYMLFSGPAWMEYDEVFRMRTAMNPVLQWDQIHLQLWMQLMYPARPINRDKPDSGHLVEWQTNLVVSHTVMSTASQSISVPGNLLLMGVCARKVFPFQHECPLYLGPHAFSAYLKTKVKSCYPKGGKQRGRFREVLLC